MAKIHTEVREVYGILQTNFGQFKLLAEHPNKQTVPWYLKEMDVLSFFVQDNDGFGKNILVRGEFVVIPYVENPTTDVHFLIDEENIKVDSLE